jgi:hypothetical protein
MADRALDPIGDMRSVAVVAEGGARRRHVGRIGGHRERGDSNHRDQSESSDEFLHDTSPSIWVLVRPLG